MLQYCEGKIGKFKIPTDVNCSSYIECESDKLLIRPVICTGNKKFDHISGKCVENYDCLDGSSLSSLSSYCVQGFDGNMADTIYGDP